MKYWALLGISIGLMACASKTLPPPNKQESLKNIDEILQTSEGDEAMSPENSYDYKKLENGLEVYAIHKGSIPMVTVMIAVKNGSFVETPDIDGLAHLYEHMFFKANEKVSSQQEFIKTLDQLGVELGPNMNAYTSTESVRYFFTIQSQFLDRGLQFMADAVRTPLFLQDELENERKVVIGEFDRYEASPSQIFFQKDVMGRLFSKYFTRKNTIGSRSVILTATPEQMHSIQHRFYIPNNSALFIVGDFTSDELWPKIEEAFGGWKSGPNPFVENPIPEHPPLEKTYHFNKAAPVQTVNIVAAYHGPSLVEDNPGTVAFDLASIMLGLESSSFQKELVHSGLSSSASMSIWSQRYTSPLIFGVETSPDKSKAAYDKLNNLIDRVSAGGFFSQSDLDTAKAALEVRSAYDREVGQRFALGLASIWTSTGSLDYYLNYIPLVKEIQLADIDKAFAQYVKGKNYVCGVLHPEDSGKIDFPDEDTPPSDVGEVAAPVEGVQQ